MKTLNLKCIYSGLIILSILSLKAIETPKTKQVAMAFFQENKGQIYDQNYNPRTDVLFSGYVGGMVYHLTNSGISYQLNRVDKWKIDVNKKTKEEIKAIDKTTIYRLDINWLGANTKALISKGQTYEGVSNYYSESCPNGAVNVKSYMDITYKNIYSGIDLKWYEKEGELKYDYLVSAGANYKQIKLEIKGAKKIGLNDKGELVLNTPLGTIIEQAPLVIQNGVVLKSNWKVDNNIIGFNIENLNPSLDFIIDPAVRTWGTYYGGTGSDVGYSTITDGSGNIYFAGHTNISTSTVIATSGSHQTSFGGSNDAMLVKFNSAGVRLWATLYGGSGDDRGYSCATDASGNICMAGSTTTSTGTVMFSAAGHQTVYAGGTNDAFLVKFNSAGVRQWGTYYGGTAVDQGYSCADDGSGNIILAGETNSGGGIHTAGAHQTLFGGGANDAFIAKFNSAGVRQWGTYYGAGGTDYGQACTAYPTGDIYLAGHAASTVSISTVGSHQASPGAGGGDAFLVKFNSTGVRQWGTYYGGAGVDAAESCATDAGGSVYMVGYTASTSNIATAGCHQATNGGGTYDGFVAKFNSSGVRQWGTFYGGTASDVGQSCAVDGSGNLYFAGYTSTSTGTVIATPGSHQTTIGSLSGPDAFLVKFNLTGVRQWGTYYGGATNDYGYSCAINGTDFYLCGYSNSTGGTAIASVGSHQPANGGLGANDAFLAKFFDCPSPSSPTNTTPGANQSRCPNNTTTLTATSSGTINWYSTPTGTTVLGTGTNYITTSLTAGTYTFYAETQTCAPSVTRTPITVTVNPSPTITVNSGSICPGQSFTIVPSGASTYTFQGGGAVKSPASTTSYTVIGTSAAGCVSQTFATSTITVNSNPTITVNSGSICSGNSFTIIPSGGTSYTYSSGSSTVSPIGNSTYTVIGASALGCTNTAISNVSVTTTPTVNTSASSNTICTGNTTTITASGATTYSWNTSATTNTISVSPTVTTTYTVTGNNGSCSNTKTITITNSTPNLNVSASSTAICSGGTSTLSASGATTYSWSTSATTSVIAVSPTGNTTYTVIGTIGSCTSTSVISVNVGSAIVINALPSASISCSGSPVIITASGASTYTWSTGPNSTTISVSPTSSTNYTVSGTSGTCSGSTVITIGASTNPVVSSVTSQSLICSLPVQQSATLTASGATTYSWNTGATTAAITVSPGISTTYTVTGYNAQGCMNTSIITQSVSACAGVNELTNENAISIYPNPSNGEFIIKGAEGKVEIINSIGQTVYIFEASDVEIKVTELASGIYYLKSEKLLSSKKIIVNN
jgi:hypothetical protein